MEDLSSRLCVCPVAIRSNEDSATPALCAVPSKSNNENPENQNPLPHVHETLEHKADHLLLILVLSSPSTSSRGRRDVARQTWIKDNRGLESSVLVKFAIGTQGLSRSDLDSLSTEQKDNSDILLLPNLEESYTNLTRKVLYSFVRLVKEYTFSYLLKCDDDSYVRQDKVAKELEKRNSKTSFYWGFFDGRAHVHNTGKWVEPDWFLCDRYLPYALGGGYVLSRDLVEKIAGTPDDLQLYSSEDVSVGVWLSPYKVERRHDVRFNTEFVSRGCRNAHIVSHKQSIDDMRSKFRLLTEQGVQCEREYQTRPSYEYNWKAPPTKCCERVKGIP